MGLDAGGIELHLFQIWLSHGVGDPFPDAGCTPAIEAFPDTVGLTQYRAGRSSQGIPVLRSSMTASTNRRLPGAVRTRSPCLPGDRSLILSHWCRSIRGGGACGTNAMGC